MYLASGFTNFDLTFEPWIWIGVLVAVGFALLAGV